MNKQRPRSYRAYKVNWEICTDKETGEITRVWRSKGYTLHRDKVLAMNYVKKSGGNHMRPENDPYMVEVTPFLWQNLQEQEMSANWV